MKPKTPRDAFGFRRREPLTRARSAGAAALLFLVVGLPLLAPMAEAAPPSGWQVARLIETDGGSTFDPQVAVDGSGNAVAVWVQIGYPRWDIYANRYAAGSGWGNANLIETDDAGNAYGPQVAVDASGNAVAVWFQAEEDFSLPFPYLRDNIWANRYVAGSGWGTATLIETDAGFALDPQVAVDGKGNAVAVWSQSDGTRFSIWANRYVAESGWGTATLIETDEAGDAWAPQVAVDGGGNALAVWHQSDGTRNNIWANRYAADSGWERATLIETDDAGDAQHPQVAVDRSGNAVAVWYQSNGTLNNTWANRYAAGSGWERATLIETDNAGDAQDPQVAVDGSGNALAVWYQSDGTRNNIWANRYAAGSGWERATLIETDDAGDAQNPQVAIDGSGEAVAVWYQSDGTLNNTWANRYAAESGWKTATLIETDNAGDAWAPQVAVDSSGNAVAVWYQDDGTRSNIWANRFDDKPPSIVLATPSERTVTNRSSVWVAGTVEVGARVSVSGVDVVVGANGTFGLLVALQPGVNRVVATAWDASDNTANATLNVTFEDPVPLLDAQLATAQADLASARSNLSAAQLSVSAMEANVTTARADLATAQSRITALETNGSAGQSAAASGQVGLAIVLAAVGIAVGAVGVALALRSRKPVVVKETVTSTAPPPGSPPPPDPPH
jgi:hypothetical protein